MMKPSAILLGSKAGSVMALRILCAHGWRIEAVCPSWHVSDDWYGGRNLRNESLTRNITVKAQECLPDDTSVDYIISYMCREKVSPAICAMAKHGAVNFHPAPLPEFSGYRGYNIAILESCTEFGCTCHYMTDTFDAGDIAIRRMFSIDPTKETAQSLESKTQEQMLVLFDEFCRLGQAYEVPRVPQDLSQRGFMTAKELEDLKTIPVEGDLETIDRYARAFWYPPYTGAQILMGGKRIEVVPSSVREDLGPLVHGGQLEHLERFTESAILASGDKQ